MNIFIKKCKTFICGIVLSTLLLHTGSAFALTYKLSLETKKLPTGITHCVWHIHLVHECHTFKVFPKKTLTHIAKNDKKAIIDFAKKVNAYVLTESMDNYTEVDNSKLNMLAKCISKTYNRFSAKIFNLLDMDDTLFGIYNTLKENNIHVENIEYRQDSFTEPYTLGSKILLVLSAIIMWKASKEYVFDHTLRIKNVVLKPLLKLGLFSYPKIIILLQIILFFVVIILKSSANKKELYIEKNAEANNIKDIFTELKEQDCGIQIYLNDTETINRIIKKEEELSILNSPNEKISHTLIVTGGLHSKNIRNILIKKFNYNNIYVTKVPKPKEKIDCADYIDSTKLFFDQGIILHLPSCFEKGLEILEDIQEIPSTPGISEILQQSQNPHFISKDLEIFKRKLVEIEKI